MKSRSIFKALALTLAIALCVGMMPSATIPVFADANEVEASNGTGTSIVKLTAEATTFKVTVPTGLPIHMAADGTITCAQDGVARITNSSYGPVEVKEVTVDTSSSDWSLLAFTADFSTLQVGLKNFAFQLMNSNVDPTDGSCSVENFSVINGNGGYITLNYDGKVAPQSGEISETVIANVIFTIGWNAATTTPSTPSTNTINIKVNNVSTSATSGVTLLSYMTAQYGSSSTVTTDENGYVTVDGEIVKVNGNKEQSSYELQENDEVTFETSSTSTPSAVNLSWSSAGVLSWDSIEYDSNVKDLAIRAKKNGTYSTVTTASKTDTRKDLNELIIYVIDKDYSTGSIDIELWTRNDSNEFIEMLDSVNLNLSVTGDELDYTITEYNSGQLKVTVNSTNAIYVVGPILKMKIGYWSNTTRGITLGKTLSSGESVEIKISDITSSTVSDDTWNLTITPPATKSYTAE